ncbi:putative glucan 1,3-beta-glucosidase I/II precursor [Scheffersomyces amazonensis]|uniref:putative glucan 1,3-beta-glucosidase I/II precursor n=1 Tax=Scheffersomyces amazonensis TaxID=1078765 RepID=UPI00315CB107
MLFSKYIYAALAVISTVQAAPLRDARIPTFEESDTVRLTKKDFSWDYDSQKIRGVNLGGWFVLEAYIVPSLFNAFEGSSTGIPVDEYHYTQYLGQDLASQRLQGHWANWYTEADFANMANLGLNFVRIPIGYWAFQLLEGDPYVQGQIPYLDRALGWAAQYGIKAWIDLHGAPGSQNGFDNSGLRDVLDWQTGDNVQVTLNVLETISQKYGNGNWSDTVIGIELVNEPLGPSLNMGEIEQFYINGYNQLRQTGSVTPVIIHDAFQPLGFWDNFMTVANGDYWNVVVDHHFYQVFDVGQLQLDVAGHISTACNWGWGQKAEYHWTVAGEFSAALTDCAPWLNGVGRGARYDGTYESPYIGDCTPFLQISTWPSWYNVAVRQYVEAQLDAFEQTGGWVFWNWKTESAPEWDFSALWTNGLFPSPLTAREYPNQCGF